jgi:hypothetical protein
MMIFFDVFERGFGLEWSVLHMVCNPNAFTLILLNKKEVGYAMETLVLS